VDFIEKVKGFLLEPSKTFDSLKEEPLEEAVKYYAIIATVYSAFLALLLAFAGNLVGTLMGFRFRGFFFGNLGMMMGTGAGIGAAIILFVKFMIILIAGAFIGGAILHIFVYIVGGRRGIAQTIKAGMYGSTPSLLFGWIPIIGFIAIIWSLVAEIIGVRQLHELTTGKAILAVILPIILTIVLAVIVLALFTFDIHTGGGAVSP
jgi:hypothetical protein